MERFLWHSWTVGFLRESRNCSVEKGIDEATKRDESVDIRRYERVCLDASHL